MKPVIVISPEPTKRSEKRAMQRYADQLIDDALSRGESPLALRQFYERLPDETTAEAMSLARGAARAWMPAVMRADGLVVVGVDHGITAHMQQDIEAAERVQAKVVMRSLKLSRERGDAAE